MEVSIITVCYNSEKTIERTIQSVLNQTYQDYEYIIVDGASTDKTLEIIKRYEPEFEGRMRWISEQDDGIYYAMNKGIGMAKGKLIGMINSDDYYEANALANMVEAQGIEDYQILYGFTRCIRDGEEVSISISSHKNLREQMISHPSSFVTKKLYDDLGMYDTRYYSASDYDFMLRMYEGGRVTFRPVYKLIANFSLGGMCASSKAYLELLDVRYRHGIISDKEYRTLLFKDKVYKLLHGNR